MKKLLLCLSMLSCTSNITFSAAQTDSHDTATHQNCYKKLNKKYNQQSSRFDWYAGCTIFLGLLTCSVSSQNENPIVPAALTAYCAMIATKAYRRMNELYEEQKELKKIK